MRNKTVCSKCKNNLESNRVGKQAYCLSCHNANMRKGRVKYSDLSEEERHKSIARSYMKVYLRKGKIVKSPCEICGDKKSEGHHINYDYPLVVQWLCRKHHIELHKENLKAV